MGYVSYPSISAKIDQLLPNQRKGIQYKLAHGVYAVGDLCDAEKLRGVRAINVGPENDNWKATFEATVLQSGFSEAALVTCAPKTRVKALKGQLEPQAVVGVTDDGVERKVTITDVLVVPEASAHALAFKQYLEGLGDNHDAMVVSVGHGTVECGIADQNGVISETLQTFPIGTALICENIRSQLLELGGKVLLGDGTTGYWDDVLIDVHGGKKRTFPMAYSSGLIDSEKVREVVFAEMKKHGSELAAQIRVWCSKWRDRPVKLFYTGGGLLLNPLKNALTIMAEADQYELEEVSAETRLRSAAIGCREIGKSLFPHQNIIAIDQGNRQTVAYYVPIENN